MFPRIYGFVWKIRDLSMLTLFKIKNNYSFREFWDKFDLKLNHMYLINIPCNY